jgi:hypothetical protein
MNANVPRGLSALIIVVTFGVSIMIDRARAHRVARDQVL